MEKNFITDIIDKDKLDNNIKIKTRGIVKNKKAFSKICILDKKYPR